MDWSRPDLRQSRNVAESGSAPPAHGPPAHGASDGWRPPRPTFSTPASTTPAKSATPTKNQRQPFVSPSVLRESSHQDLTLGLHQGAPGSRQDLTLGLHQGAPGSRVHQGAPGAGGVRSLAQPASFSVLQLSSSAPAFGHTSTWPTHHTTSAPTASYKVADDMDLAPMPYFDWSPDAVLTRSQDPSSSLMNILTQDADADLVLLGQQDATPSSGKKGGRGSRMLLKESSKGRGGNYTQKEDLQICTSWMHISNDPIRGNEQPIKSYWERIAEDFHKNKEFESDRNPNSLEHRCGVILKECMAFQGFYEDAVRRHPSVWTSCWSNAS